MKKIWEIDAHNMVRVLGRNYARIVEIGMGDDRTTDETKGSGMAVVESDAVKGIAIGHDTYVKDDYGIALGDFQKAIWPHSMAFGGYLNNTSRYGESRRTFGGDSEYYSRNWFEWHGLVEYDMLIQSYVPLYLHGQSPNKVVLKDYSGMVFNIKVIGTDLNTSPQYCAYHLSGAIGRGNGAASTAIIGTVTKDAWEDDVTCDADVVADIVEGALSLEIKEHASQDWHWAASGWVTELRFPAPP